MKLLLSNIIFLVTFSALTQTNNVVYEINYASFEHEIKATNPITFYYKDGIAFLSKTDQKIQQYIDFNKKENKSTITFNDTLFMEIIPFSNLPAPTFDSKKDKKILGYDCQYAKYFYFSNTIEVWFSEKTIPKGSPYRRYLPNEIALVLEILINGTRRITATSITKLTKELPKQNLKNTAKIVNTAEF